MTDWLGPPPDELPLPPKGQRRFNQSGSSPFCRKCGGRCERIVNYRLYCEHCGSQPFPASYGFKHDR